MTTLTSEPTVAGKSARTRRTLRNGETYLHAVLVQLLLIGAVLGVVVFVWWLVWLIRTGA